MYRIEFTIQRSTGNGEYEDIGFGSSGSWSDPDQAAHMVTSAVQNREWETEAGMPDPTEIDG